MSVLDEIKAEREHQDEVWEGQSTTTSTLCTSGSSLSASVCSNSARGRCLKRGVYSLRSRRSLLRLSKV